MESKAVCFGAKKKFWNLYRCKVFKKVQGNEDYKQRCMDFKKFCSRISLSLIVLFYEMFDVPTYYRMHRINKPLSD